MGVMYIGGNKVIPIFKETQIVPYPGYGVVINNPDTEHQEVVAQLEPTWKTKEYNETFIAGADNAGVKLHLYINTTVPGYAHGQLSWTPSTFVNGSLMDGQVTVTATAATPIEDVVIPTGYEDYYLKNNTSNFYNDTNYDSYKSRSQLSGKIIVFDLNNWLPSQSSVNMGSMFYMCSNITELDLSNLNTNKVNNMNQMFTSCNNLTSLNVSNFDTSKVTAMNNMFDSCSSLTSLDVSNWDTSNVYNISAMFNGCSSLTSLNVSNFDTSKVTAMNSMFQSCSSLTSLDLSNFDTSNVTTMRDVFNGCFSLKILDLSNFDTSKVTNMNSMFYNCSSLQYLIIDSNTFKFQAKTSMSSMYLPNTCKILVPQALISTYQSATNWSTYANNFEAIENYNIVRTNGEVLVLPASVNDYYLKNNVTDFYEDKNYTTSVTRESLTGDIIVFDLDNYLPSQSSVSFNNMFEGCSSITSLDLSHLNTNKVTTSYQMFKNCNNLLNIKFNGWDTSSITNMSQMFIHCNKLETLNVSDFNTNNCTSLQGTFQYLNKLKTINVTGFNTSNVTNIGNTFQGCTTIESLDLSSWDTSSVTNMNNMFNSCTSLKVLDLSNWDTTNVPNNDYDLFTGCSALEYLIIGSSTFKFVAKGSMDIPANCKILVPQALISTYQSANYWSEHASKFDAIENYNIVRTNGKVIVVDANVEDYYLKDNINNFYTDQTYSSYVSKNNLAGDIVVFDTNNYLKSTNTLANFFSQCNNITSLDVSNLDTNNITNMALSFYYMPSIKSINLNNWNTSNVTNMESMFQSNCAPLLNINHFDTSNVIRFHQAFLGCKSKSLDLSNWDTSNAENMYSMFSGCETKIIDISNFDTSNVTNMGSFISSSYLQFLIINSNTFKLQLKSSISLPTTCKILVPQALISTYQSATNWSTHSSKFEAIENYTITKSNGEITVSKPIDLSSYVNIDDNYNLENYYKNDNGIVTAEFTNLETVNGLEVMKSMFDNCDGLKIVLFSKLRSIDGNNAMSYMFNGCDNLETVSFPLLQTINNTSDSNGCSYMFYNSKADFTVSFPLLTTIGINGLYYCFRYCTSLTTAPTFANLTTVGDYGLYQCFAECSSLTTAPTFASLTTIGSSGLYTCFKDCTSLVTAPTFASLTTIGNQGLGYCFQNTKITSISFPALTSTSFGSYTNCFDYMLYGVTGCTVHFPSNLQSVIGSWTGVMNGMKGTNTTVLYDLPATS